MLFYILGFLFFSFGLLFSEAITSLCLVKKLKNNKDYILTFLLRNQKNETLEEYFLNSFFPRYFISLFFLLLLCFVNQIYYADSIIKYGCILGSLTYLRMFNIRIFSALWKIIK